jgi:hypothetical protein
MMGILGWRIIEMTKNNETAIMNTASQVGGRPILQSFPHEAIEV